MPQIFLTVLSTLIVQVLIFSEATAQITKTQSGGAQLSEGQQSPGKQQGQTQKKNEKKSHPTGDIDMNQFDNLKSKPKPADSNMNIQGTCTTPQGTLIKKGEPGFDTCLANAQSPVMNQPRTTEKENDPRKQ